MGNTLPGRGRKDDEELAAVVSAFADLKQSHTSSPWWVGLLQRLDDMSAHIESLEGTICKVQRMQVGAQPRPAYGGTCHGVDAASCRPFATASFCCHRYH